VNGERKNEWRELCSFFMSQPCFNLIIKSCVTHSHFLPYILLLIKHAVHEEHNFLPSSLSLLLTYNERKWNMKWAKAKRKEGRRDPVVVFFLFFSLECVLPLHYITNQVKRAKKINTTQNKPQQTKRPDSQNQQQTKGSCVGFFAFKLKQNHASFHSIVFCLI